MRTSGLLSRSNKVMYDLDSRSVFDTFAGIAVTGPLRELGVVLDQASVVTTTWADWRQTHPDTSIVAEDGGIGRSYDLDPLQGRDDDGPDHDRVAKLRIRFASETSHGERFGCARSVRA